MKQNEPTEKDGKDFLFGREKCAIYLSRHLYELGNPKYIAKVQSVMSHYRREINMISVSNLEPYCKLNVLRRTRDDYKKRLNILVVDPLTRQIMTTCVHTWCLIEMRIWEKQKRNIDKDRKQGCKGYKQVIRERWKEMQNENNENNEDKKTNC